LAFAESLKARHCRRSQQLIIKTVETEMERQATVVLYVLLLVAVIFGVDFLFFRNRFWERLIVNIGIVLVFAAFYWRFLKHR
jgi:hypothetical protein